MSFVRQLGHHLGAGDGARSSIVDSLSGGSTMLGEHGRGVDLRDQGAAVGGRAARHLEEGDKSGSLRMIRAKERRVLK